MTQENQEYRHHTNNTLNVLVGMLVGGLAGAVTMLLLAPQSGKDTRLQIREKGIELRDRANEIMEDTATQIRSSAKQLTESGSEAIKELAHQGQKIAVEGLDRVSEVAKAGKTAVQRA